MGTWDLAQVCGHCAHGIHGAIDGFKSTPPFFVRLMVRLTGMKKKIYRTRTLNPGLPAPADSVPAPGATGDRDAQAKAVQEFATAVDRLKNHAGALQIHPVFGRISREEWLEFHTIHAMHHLTFLVPTAKGA